MTWMVRGNTREISLRALKVPVAPPRKISSSSSLTGYLPVSSPACLPTLRMHSAKMARLLAC